MPKCWHKAPPISGLPCLEVRLRLEQSLAPQANVRAGGKPPVAEVVHAITILLVMLLAAPVAGYPAMPALARLLIRLRRGGPEVTVVMPTMEKPFG